MKIMNNKKTNNRIENKINNKTCKEKIMIKYKNNK